MKWAAASGGGANWSLVNTGGTALTGAATITVSGISNADKILMLIEDAGSASGNSTIRFRLNSDSSNKYSYFGTWIEFAAAYSGGNSSINRLVNGDVAPIFNLSSNQGSIGAGYVRIDGCNASGVKAFTASGNSNAGGGTNQIYGNMSGVYTGTSTITSISLISGTGNFDAGTIYVYTSA